MGKTKKILMADDEINILAIAGAALKQQGYDIITVSNGEEAVKKALAEMPDLIILDRNMPVMGGLEACKKIRKTGALNNIPVIFLTAQNSEKEILEGLAGGANDYLTKPFNMNDLIERVNAVFSK